MKRTRKPMINNFVRSAVAVCRAAGLDVTVPVAKRELSTLGNVVVREINRALSNCHGNRRRAAMQLGIPERTLYRLIGRIKAAGTDMDSVVEYLPERWLCRAQKGG